MLIDILAAPGDIFAGQCPDTLPDTPPDTSGHPSDTIRTPVCRTGYAALTRVIPVAQSRACSPFWQPPRHFGAPCEVSIISCLNAIAALSLGSRRISP